MSPRWGFGNPALIVFYYDGALTELNQNECANPHYEILQLSIYIMITLIKS
jgi:hypothetical protein